MWMTKSYHFIFIGLIARFCCSVQYLPCHDLFKVIFAMYNKRDTKNKIMSFHRSITYCTIFLQSKVFISSSFYCEFYLQSAVKVVRIIKTFVIINVWLLHAWFTYIIAHFLSIVYINFLLRCIMQVMRSTKLSLYMCLWFMAWYSNNVPCLSYHGYYIFI